jgi:transmembrane 9 superfamily protein 2/4
LRRWWRAYLTPGSSALYLYLYSILYFFTKLSMVKLVSALLFFGYMALVCAAFFVLTGSIGESTRTDAARARRESAYRCEHA